MSADPDADSWTFVQVDPTAPKKRRKRRKPSPIPAPPEPQPVLAVDLPENVEQAYSPSFDLDHSQQHYRDDVPDQLIQAYQPTERERASGPLAAMNDFDRFLLLSDEREADKMDWTELFGENLFTPWTPMAVTPVQSALFDFYPSTFHAALAVAGAHWANRLRLGDRSAEERTLKQVRLLNLASSYHRGIAQDIVKQPLGLDMSPAARQAAEEARVGSKILNMTWQTFSDGFIVRGELLRDVHRVIRPSATGVGVVGAMGRFLRIWLSWVDTLDSAAHKRGRATWDTTLVASEQEKVDYALQRTVGCTPETLRLIARTSALSATATFLDLEAVRHHAALAADLQGEILENLSQRIEGDEASTAARSFALALHLYFLTSVQQSALEHPSVVWGVQQFLNLVAHSEAQRHRQAWATWPYFILGLHVSSSRHRRRVVERFTWLAATLSVGNLSTLRTCLELLWERRDNGETTTWQEISVSLGGAIVTPL